MSVREIRPSDTITRGVGSYDRIGIRMGGLVYCEWTGYATIRSGVTAANLDITIPSQQKGKPDTASLMIPANSVIRSVGFRTLGNVTLGAATGKLKLATALTAATTGLFVESAAASANTLAAQATPVEQQNITPVTIGGADATLRLFATDGGAGAAAVASTVTAAKDTKVLVRVAFIRFPIFPTEDEVGYSAAAVGV
jgi:hypothetical protein